jgi:hypothetical protein
MMFTADSTLPPAPPMPRPPQPAGWEKAWTIDLNPQQGSSILGPRSPAAGPPAAVPPPPPQRVPDPPAALRLTTIPTPEVAPPVAPRPVPAVAPLTPRAASRRKRAPIALWPLIAFNAVFDWFLSWFGPPGRWACGPSGRTLMGSAGVLMFVAAVAWGVLDWYDWFGWTW